MQTTHTKIMVLTAVSLNFYIEHEKVKHHIRIKIVKFSVLKFWIVLLYGTELSYMTMTYYRDVLL